MNHHLTHASLFSGIGGFDLAAEWAGYENIFHCDNNAFCTQVLAYHFPESVNYEDITKTDFSRYRGCIDVLTGGFPCQPFSVAGKRRGADDDRYLWPYMLAVIRQIRPTWVIGENVAGIASMVLPGKVVEMAASPVAGAETPAASRIEERRFVLDSVCEDLEREGYSVQPFVIPACGVGAPHRRDRVWIVARLRGRDALAADSGGIGCHDGSDPRSGGCICVDTNGDAAQDYPPRGGRERRSGTAGEALGSSADADRLGRNPHGYPGYGQTAHETERDAIQFVAAGSCPERFAADSGGERQERRQYAKGSRTAIRQHPARPHTRPGATQRPKPDWSQFPTQPPLYARNDGISRRLAGCPLSDGRWRTEAVKACGNAIVPQVAYELLEAIRRIEQENYGGIR